MQLLIFSILLALLFFSEAVASPREFRKSDAVVNQTTCNGKQYTYESLAGYGYVPSNARDKFGDTLAGLGSSAVLDVKTWQKNSNSYSGILWALPDRGWNTEGTLNYQPRVHKFNISLTLVNASLSHPSKPNLEFNYLDTIRFTGPDGTPTTGLDPDAVGALQYPGFPDLPGATYTGDGFGGDGPGGHRVSVDPEGLILNADGSFWVSDEYGPYIYKFSSEGNMLQAIRPPEAFIPRRDGSESFNADSAPRYNPDFEVTPEDPESGRQNNQGFEGLTISPDGRTMSVLIQSALQQEGGDHGESRFNARLVQYSLPSSDDQLSHAGENSSEPVYKAEYVVPLPVFVDSDDDESTAGQSEIHYVSPTQYLVIARDSNKGAGQDETRSLYRHVDVFDISNATDVKSAANDAPTGAVASDDGDLDGSIRAAEYCSWLDFNVNSELGKFGLHNGGEQDDGLLNEKWESLVLAPIDGDEYFLFSISDNDFITQDGYMDGGQLPYVDESGYELQSQALVFRVKLPEGSKPLKS